MHSDNTSPRAMKYATASIFTLIALAVILQDIIDPRDLPGMLSRWSLQHTLAAFLVIAVTLSIEAALDAQHEGRRGLCAGFWLVAVIGLLLVAYNSGGRQAEAQSNRDRVALAHNAQIDAAERRLGDAIAAKSKIDADALKTAAERHCATNCKAVLLASQTAAAQEVEAARAERIALAPPMAVGSTKAAYWADTLSWVFPAAVVEHVAPRFEYVLLTLFAEIGAAFGWIALRPRPIAHKDRASGQIPEHAAEQPQASVTEQPNTAPEQPQKGPEKPANATPRPTPRTSVRTAKRGKGKRWQPSKIVSDLMLRSATGQMFESDNQAAQHYGYSRSRFCELVKSWQADGSLPAGAAVSKRRAMEAV